MVETFLMNLLKKIRTYRNIRANATGQRGDCKNVCLLDYLYVKKNYKLTAINLSKHEALDVDSKALQQINSIRN